MIETPAGALAAGYGFGSPSTHERPSISLNTNSFGRCLALARFLLQCGCRESRVRTGPIRGKAGRHDVGTRESNA